MTVGLFNDTRQYINKHCLLPVLYTLSLWTCVHNMHIRPLIYIPCNTMDCIMRYVFSLRVFNRWAHIVELLIAQRYMRLCRTLTALGDR